MGKALELNTGAHAAIVVFHAAETVKRSVYKAVHRRNLPLKMLPRQGLVVNAHAEHPFIIFVPTHQRNPEELRVVGMIDAAEELESHRLHRFECAFRAQCVVVAIVLRYSNSIIDFQNVAFVGSQRNACRLARLNTVEPSTADSLAVAHNLYAKWRSHFASIAHFDVHVVAILVRTAQAVIHALGRLNEVIEKPREVFPRNALKHFANILGLRMLEFPGFEIGGHASVHAFFPQVLHEVIEGQRCFLVHYAAVVQIRVIITAGFNGLVGSEACSNQVGEFLGEVIVGNVLNTQCLLHIQSLNV